MTEPRSGHRGVPHTADLRIEAWAPTLQACLREAVAALVESITDTTDAAPETTFDTEVPVRDDQDALVRVLDEVIYLLDVQGMVPLDAQIMEIESGYRLRMPAVFVGTVEVSTVPKAVTLQDLGCDFDGRRWNCAATIDV